VIQAPRRDELLAWLKQQGVGAGIHYPVPIHLQKAVSYLGYGPGSLPVTEQVVGEILSLPIYAEMSEVQIGYVAGTVKEFYAQ